MSKKKVAKGNPSAKKDAGKLPQKKIQAEPNALLLLSILIITTIFVYASSLKNGWTNWDDEGYVLNNDLVKSIDLRAIFSTYVMGNYHPITVLVQAIEYHFFADNASAFHTFSLLFHIANALLLFYAIQSLTKKSVVAFLSSLLFAIHPLHVESVSWVSAQKDLLYTGFYFAAIICYLKFKSTSSTNAQGNGMVFYVATLIAFVLSILSKGQAVTLPVIFLLIDFYQEKKIGFKNVIDKIPFFILSFIFGIIAILAQKQSASIQDLEEHSFVIQLLFASFSFISYVLKSFLPINLSAYYPYPEKAGSAYPFYIYTAPLIIAIAAYLIFRFRKKNPSIIFGAGFFLVNIFLVLQLLPVGGAMMADRYTYLSAVGIFFPVAVFLNDVWERKSDLLTKYRTPFIFLAGAWLVFLFYQTRSRTNVWKSSETLWSDVIKKFPRVPIAQNNLGSYYQKHDQLNLAKQHFDAALTLQPDFANALINRCDYFRTTGKIDSAIIDGNHAVHLEPQNPDAHQNRGIAFGIAGKLDSALSDFKFVVAHQPNNARAFNNLGNLYSIKTKYDSALVYYNAALKADPSFIDVLNNRGKCFVFLGKYPEAIYDLSKAIENNPTNPNNYYFRMQAYQKLGKKTEALDDANKAISLGLKIPEEEMQLLQ